MGELISYMVGANAPSELKTEAENQMQAVEECNHGGATDKANCEMLCKTHNRAKGNR